MKERTLLANALLIVLLLSLGLASLSQAQEPDGPESAPPAAPSVALGTSFTYQGRLTDGGKPANGAYDFRFQLYDAASSGGQVGSTLWRLDIPVSDGLFSAGLDFGNVFNGAASWLQIGLRPGASSGAFTNLSPRQELTATPYALYALKVAAHNHWGESWTGSGAGLTLSGGDIGLSGSGATSGVYGDSDNTSGRGMFGWATAASGATRGVFGRSDSTSGTGVYGHASAASGVTYGVLGKSDSDYGKGVYGWASATSGYTFGVNGVVDSTSGTGVYGRATANSGYTYGVYGQSYSTQGRGVLGLASATSGTTYGVRGESISTDGTGLYGWAYANSGFTYGVYGQSDSAFGTGVYGYASAGTFGVYGRSDSTNGTGVLGYATATSGGTHGVYGQSASTDGYGVRGVASATSGGTYGVWGETNSTNGVGVYGEATGTSAQYAGYFYGDVHVTGDLSATGSKPFKIDHPLDPANQYLYHYSIESSEVLNQYSGNVALDENGQAWVELPAWFPAINTDFRYQLTCIGSFAPVYIAQEIEGNRFKIAGGEPGMKISWTVTALRNDPYMRQYPQPVEQTKPDDELGTYLYPELYGQPPEAGLDYQRNPDLETPELQGGE